MDRTGEGVAGGAGSAGPGAGAGTRPSELMTGELMTADAAAAARGCVGSAGALLRDPLAGPRAYVRRCADHFGVKFLILLSSVYLLVKGFLVQVIQTADLPYFRDYLGVGAAEYQRLQVFYMTPWAAKALIGTISDLFPLGGFHKRNYCLLACVLGAASLCTLGLLPLAGPDWAHYPAATLMCAPTPPPPRLASPAPPRAEPNAGPATDARGPDVCHVPNPPL